MKREDWPAPVFEQESTFSIGDTVRILQSKNSQNKNTRKNDIVGRLGTVMSGLREQTNPNSTKYVGYEIKVDGYRDSLNAHGYCLIPAYRLQIARRPIGFLGKVSGRLRCLVGDHDMVWGFGFPVPGHCARGCGHREVDAD